MPNNSNVFYIEGNYMLTYVDVFVMYLLWMHRVLTTQCLKMYTHFNKKDIYVY